jgi:hypothetical protein
VSRARQQARILSSFFMPSARSSSVVTPRLVSREPASKKAEFYYFNAVLQIRDILVWIRIRGSVPLTAGSGLFSSVATMFFCLLLFEATFT